MDRQARAANYLALLALPGVGPVTVAELTALAGGLERLVTTRWTSASLVRQPNGDWGPVAPETLQLLRGLPSRVGAFLPAARLAVAEAASAGLAVLDVDDIGYPPALRSNLTGPPPVLFVEGALPPALAAPYDLLPACAVVGTRRASRFSLSYAKDLSLGLARLGVVVVSGLALGIDAAAHAGALEGAALAPSQGGGTVAVLGGGHGHLHPAANRPLAAAIVGSGGAVLSEWPPGVAPAPHQFLQRNRIISGLARAVVVVEAGRRSGALNTASHALKQGRDVLVVPGRPGAAMAGNLGMLRDGAKMLEGIADLDETFADVPGVGDALARLVSALAADDADGVGSDRAERDRSDPDYSALGRVDYERAGPDRTGPERAGPEAVEPAGGILAERVKGVLEELGEATVDNLLAALNSATTPEQRVSVGALTASLIELELAGAVEAGGNGRYQLRVSPARGRGWRAQ